MNTFGCNKPESFIETYEVLFRGREPKHVLEIGVQTGHSLRMLAHRFPEAQIVGLDIDVPSESLPEKNITFIQGSQNDTRLLQKLTGFDIIIDDGSHMTADQQLTFSTLFPLLNKGGIYVIEDIELHRQAQFKNSPLTTAEYFRVKLNPKPIQNNENFSFLDEGIRGITFLDNMLIITKP